MDIYHTIVRPLVTEKGTHQSHISHDATRSQPARGGAYTFEVHPEANKAQIRQAVEAIYNVKVKDVHTMNRKGKPRRAGTKMATTSEWKRAIVKLDENSRIELY